MKALVARRSRVTWAAVVCAFMLGMFVSPVGADGGEIEVTFTADDMGLSVSSSKDISNVIVELCDGTMHKHDGLNGHRFEHREDQKIVGVWVKSGNNGAGGDAPSGAGERFDNDGVSCEDAPDEPGPTPTSSAPPPATSEPSPPPASSSPPPSSTDAEITVTFTTDDKGFTVSSSKDISNVIVELCDGTMHKHDGLNGPGFEHREDQKVVGVWVKSGDNGAGDGAPPGAGERFDNEGVVCDEPSQQPPPPTSSAPGPTPSSPPSNPPPSNPPPSSGDAEITVTFTDDDKGFTATSTKDISNVIVELCDGTMHKHDGLNGPSFEHREDQKILRVWVKSGDNGAGGDAPPGAGERFDNHGVVCDDAPQPTGEQPPSSSTPPPATSPTQPPAGSPPAATTSHAPPPSSENPPSGSEGAPSPTTSGPNVTPTTPIPVFPSGAAVLVAMVGSLGGAFLLLRRR